MFKNMKLGFKISAGFAAILIIAVLLGGFCVLSMKNTQVQAGKLSGEFVPEAAVANNVERTALSIIYAIRGYSFTYDEKYLEEGRKGLEDINKYLKDAKELGEKNADLGKLKENAAKAQEGVDAYSKLVDETQAGIKTLAEQQKKLDESGGVFVNTCNAYIALQNNLMDKAISSGKVAGMSAINDKTNIVVAMRSEGNQIIRDTYKAQSLRDPKIVEATLKNFDQIYENSAKLDKFNNTAFEKEQIIKNREAAKTYNSVINSYVETFIKLQETTKLRQEAAAKVIEAAKETTILGMDQTKGAANSASVTLAASSGLMIIGLIGAVAAGSFLAWIIVLGITKPINRIVEGLNETANQVSSASGQLSSSSQQLAEGSAEQAASIEETSSTLEESASMVRQNTENTKQAAILAKNAKDAAGKGNREMAEMMTSMTELKKSSDQIAKIIKVIDEIAFQTNILALNAAVEAARAGEAGMGFAVVAEEVRNLAQRSAQAAKDTAEIIESNIHLSEQGVAVSKNVNTSLTEINEQAQKVSDLLDEVSAASQEQAQGLAQINKAISQMEQVVQSNASTAEESASASEELSSQSVNMKDIVNSLVQLVNGANAIQEQTHVALAARATQRLANPHANQRSAKTNPKFLGSKNTKAVKPEDVIPLEDDSQGF